jgi:hypothetical protein
MKRVLCALALGVTALAVPAAHAAETVTVTPATGPDRYGVGVTYGQYHQPVGGAYVYPQYATACAGLSYEVPFCVTVPVQH